MSRQITGVIAEYNPLHRGHQFHLDQARGETDADLLVVAMSGNFVQRGEPALINKWDRTRMALLAGVDLVVEIPTCMVLNSAQVFAQAGIGLLSACGVHTVSFGSEVGNLEPLVLTAHWLSSDAGNDLIRQALKTGTSYPRAVQMAAEQAPPEVALCSGVLASANNILGIEYLRAGKQLAPSLKYHTVQRVGPGHRSPDIAAFGSATALRNAVRQGDLESAFKMVPNNIVPIMASALARLGPIFSQNFSQLIFWMLRNHSSEMIRAQTTVSEGLENRLKKFSRHTNDLETYIDLVKTKRYPRTRIQRILMQLLLGFRITQPLVPYIRVLGHSSQGKELAKSLSSGPIPVIFSPVQASKILPDAARTILEQDVRAGEIYALVTNKPSPSDLGSCPLSFPSDRLF